uniref:Uncharacterized protein n=1 Tax=Panagrolaimus sp. ES5 TaxID=591445 RepID=A0AC34FJH9_9BILA
MSKTSIVSSGSITMEKNSNSMGLFGAISYIIGNIVGSGIFITPASILSNVDSVGLSLVVWVVAAAISVLGAFCYVELGTSIRKSGADYAYICYVKWYSMAFSFMCVGCILVYPATLAVQAEVFSEYIIRGIDIKFASQMNQFWAKKCLSFSLIWLLLFLNFFSIKTFVSRFQIVASLAKALACIIIIGTGFYFLAIKGRTENLQNMFENSTTDPKKIVDGLFAGLFSYDGWDIINFGMEEVENPKRTMPLAIIIAMALIALFYLALNVSYFAILSPSQVKSSTAVAIDFANGSLGDFKYSIPFFIAVLLVGSLNSTLFSASRFLYAASREGHLPGFISCVNKYHDSPRAALFINVLLAMIFSFVGNLDTLIQYISFAQWFQRMITMIALLWIRFRHKPVHPDAIKTPIVLPIFFFLVCTALTGVTIWESIDTACVALALLLGGFVIYAIFIWSQTLNRFECYRNFANKFNNKTSIFTQIVFNGMIDQGLVDDQDPASGLIHDKEIISQKLKEAETKTHGFINKGLDVSSESTISFRGNANEKVKPVL